jgi:hypothetical protein
MRIICPMVMEFKHTLMEKYIVGCSGLACVKGMNSSSMKITMSMTANGMMEREKEKECLKKHQLEDLKEDLIKIILSKKSLKSLRLVIEHHNRRKSVIKSTFNNINLKF